MGVFRRSAGLVGPLVAITQLLYAQHSATPAPPASPPPFERFALAIGTLREKPFLGVQVRGLAYLTREDRPVSLRAEAYVGWTPHHVQQMSTPVDAVTNGTVLLHREWWEAGGALAAVVHARPKSSLSPYAIVEYRVSEQWAQGSGEIRDEAGRQLMALPAPGSRLRGEVGLGFGLRFRVGRQLLRVEMIGHGGQLGLSVGMSIPF
jgi:hypothetical protein